MDRYDIVIASDYRHFGGTALSCAEEIRAQARAGYRTALVQIPSPKLKVNRGLNKRIAACIHAGYADLVPADQPLRARALILRLPAMFMAAPSPAPRIEADVKLMIANQPPRDGTDPEGEPRYDVRTVSDRLEQLFGGDVQWAPIGPALREILRDTPVGGAMTGRDWVNIIDIDEWASERQRFVTDRPVIGRHGREDWRKWPDSADEILAAYPDDPSFLVKILGGQDAVGKILNRTPDNWVLYGLGTMHPRRFLREIDFFVYFHHSGWVESFGRTILEALASGAPAIVPESSRDTFQDACIYAAPTEVREIVRSLYEDSDAYHERSTLAREFAREHFSYEVHQARIRELIGKPNKAAPRMPRAPARREGSGRIALMTANGEGMGHLTRMMAVARHLPPEIDPLFITLSPKIDVVREAGYLCEHLFRAESWKKEAFHALERERLVEIFRRYEIQALAFDGPWAHQGLSEAKQEVPIPYAWVRRGMWKEGVGENAFLFADCFDLVIEPGDLAAADDRGLTAARRDEALQVDPILLLDSSEVFQRDRARLELGIDPSATAILVHLGANNRDDLVSAGGQALAKLLRRADTAVVFSESSTSNNRVEPPDGVRRITIYPLIRYLSAFDFAISAAGYNSFHELIAAAVPTIFVPMPRQLDDQYARARYAERGGFGLALEQVTTHALERCVSIMLDPDQRNEMSARAAMALPGNNGARAAAEAILKLARGGLPAGVGTTHHDAGSHDGQVP